MLEASASHLAANFFRQSGLRSLHQDTSDVGGGPDQKSRWRIKGFSEKVYELYMMLAEILYYS